MSRVTAGAEIKAQDLILKAEKTLKKWFGGSAKFEDAAELYEKAATQFKIAKKFSEAGDTYSKAAEIYRTKCADEHASCTHLVHAANCYKKVDLEKAISAFQTAIDMHMDNNRLSTAGKLYKEVGELCVEENDLKHAIDAFDNAADCYATENSQTTANQCLLKVAHISAQLKDYKRAVTILEDVANQSIDNNLLKWSVKDYYFKATLCHMALGAKSNDIEVAKEALCKYEDSYPAFEQTREFKFLTALLDAFDEGDIDKFTDVIYEFDNISKLDDWKTTILFEIKNALKSGDFNLSGNAADLSGNAPNNNQANDDCDDFLK